MKRKKKQSAPYWVRSAWWRDDPLRKRASIRVMQDHEIVYEVFFDDITEEELEAHGPTIFNLYIVGVSNDL
jgi:hypothetical protein